MIINTNIGSLNAQRNLMGTNNAMQKSLEKLSSGYRINKAADDAAGLAISEKMRGQIRGLDQAQRNAQDGISMLQTAEGALSETQSILQRMRELSVQAASDTMTDADRSSVQTEITQLNGEIDRIRNSTTFNTKSLLNGNLAASTTAQGTIYKSTLQLNATTSTGAAVAVSGSKLTNLLDNNNNSLGLSAGDKITINGSIAGVAITAKVVSTATSTATVTNLLSTIKSALAITAGTVTISAGKIIVKGDNGISQAITGLSVTATDSTGATQRSSFNNFMSNMTITQAAKDAHSDTSAVLQIGADGNNASLQLKMDINDMGASALGTSGINLSTQGGALNAIQVIDNATKWVSDERSKIGAVQNRLDHTINNLAAASENLSAAESRIRDVDMAKEMSQFTKNQVLSQAGVAMLAQANQAPQ
ncbi:MAG: flagellin N-terminal helical domain-containing protein, partial [Desulfitobacteriaceae bacterium]